MLPGDLVNSVVFIDSFVLSFMILVCFGLPSCLCILLVCLFFVLVCCLHLRFACGFFVVVVLCLWLRRLVGVGLWLLDFELVVTFVMLVVWLGL